MRRSAIGLVAAAAVLVGQAALGPAALAAGSTTITWRPATPPDGTGFWSSACPTTEPDPVHQALDDDSSSVAGTRTMVPGESGGDIAWQYAPPSSVQGGPVFTANAPGTLTGFGIHARGTTAAGLAGRLLAYYPNPANPDDFYVGVAELNYADAAWHTIDASASMLWWEHKRYFGKDWTPVNPKSFLDPTNQPQSVANFTNARSYAAPMLLSYQFGCTGGPVQLDHISLAESGSTTSYDLENTLTATSLAAADSVVDPGSGTTLTGAVTTTPSGAAITTGAVNLQARPYGASSFTTVGTVPLDNPAGVQVRPDGTTDYRWSFPGNDDLAPSVSSPVTVTVQGTITGRLLQRKLLKGQRYTMTGTVLPARASTAVTVQRLVKGSWQRIGSATTTADGTFRYVGRATTTGPSLLRASVDDFAGNLGASARASTLVVREPTAVTAGLVKRAIVAGKRFRVTGTASVRQRGVLVKLQHKVGGHWRTIERTGTGRHGAFRLKAVATKAGRWKLRVVVVASGYQLSGHSPTFRLRVKPKPKPLPAPTPTPSPKPKPAPSPSTGGGSSGGSTGGSGGGSTGGGGGGTGIG
ncbi:hypothetical protein [Nocardioides terrisoli]|uniref:hypothetical protein n=1 Tax=Nocardioides terrisoli TaxID=3388267 RepID=UPI00287B646E|nr:hypothetical protein [Nocardioides marmorisolisilvae]